MTESSIYIAPEGSESDDDIAGREPTIVNITNYYAGPETKKVHNNFVRGGTDDSVLY